MIVAITTLSACSSGRVGPSGLGSDAPPNASASGQSPGVLESDTVWSYFNAPDQENQVLVNKYIWNASLEVLNFLPIQSVDPFTGVIVTGYGTPPGGGRAYRATVLIDDPALDARALSVALQTSGGASASPATVRAVEDAILSRARQLRIADNKL
jgi:hypothetical protein